MGIWGKYFVQGSFGTPEIKRSCYHTNCDLSGASVMVHVHTIQGRIYMLLVLAVFW